MIARGGAGTANGRRDLTGGMSENSGWIEPSFMGDMMMGDSPKVHLDVWMQVSVGVRLSPSEFCSESSVCNRTTASNRIRLFAFTTPLPIKEAANHRPRPITAPSHTHHRPPLAQQRKKHGRRYYSTPSCPAQQRTAHFLHTSTRKFALVSFQSPAKK